MIEEKFDLEVVAESESEETFSSLCLGFIFIFSLSTQLFLKEHQTKLEILKISTTKTKNV